MITIVFTLQLVVFIANFLLGIFVLEANYKALTNRLYAIFSIALAFWNLAIFFTLINVWPQLIWSRLGFTFGVVMATALFYFSIVFITAPQKHYWTFFLTIVGGILSVLTLTRLMVSRVAVVSGYITGDLGPVFPFFTIFVLVSFFGGR